MEQHATDPFPEPSISDSLLAHVLEEFERDGSVALERLRQRDGRLAERVQALVHGLGAAGLVQVRGQIGRFRLQERLGHGAMGEVWRARDAQLQRDVAIKTLAGPLLGSPIAMQRFEREMRAVARLRHPAIVSVHEVGMHDGVPFLVMELIDGGSLATDLAAARAGASGSGAASPLWSVGAACRLGIALCEGLQAAHEAGVVHRDVKPSNVLLRASGAPLLADFGLAQASGDPTLTAPGDFVGTVAYAAPEVLDGRAATPQSDVFSLAATLFECLSGQVPFGSTSAVQMIRRALTSDVPYLRRLRPEVTPDLEAVLIRALEREPTRRYRSAREFGDELQRIAVGAPVRARRLGALQRTWRWARRRPATATAVVAPLLLTIAFACWFMIWQARSLARYEQLADVRVVAALQTEVARLWPALPATVPRMQEWLRASRRIIERLPEHRRELEHLERSVQEGGSAAFATDAVAWQHSVLQQLCKDIESFRPLLPLIEARAAHCGGVRLITVDGDDARAAWARASQAIAASPRYGGLVLVPQLGLVPLGESVDTGLWEFWHPLTGARPAPAPTGAVNRWQMEEATGMVFVLVPGGRYRVGCHLPSDEHPIGSPFVDPLERRVDTPCEDIELSAFFLSKYECTQPQWERLTGLRPSVWDHRKRQLISPVAPVESVSWDTANEVLDKAGMRLPTDAQWEVVYRAGTTTVYPRGNDAISMHGVENVWDLAWARSEGTPIGSVEPFDDGFESLSGVGQYRANSWGFHDLVGNVAEFCRDVHNGLEQRRAPGDGLLQGSGSRWRMVRGSSWIHRLDKARSAATDVILHDTAKNFLGVRPVIAVVR